ncbi:MAG: hypothetical protein H7Y86_15005 [Rhizobacter sp.]|nr:hypothetical protein [Ferruginibacter sp.]
MSISKFYIIGLLLIVAATQSCYNKGNLPDLRETYQYKDTKPFGGYVAHSMLTTAYPDKMINVNKKSFNDFRSETYVDSSSFYMTISKKFYCSEADAESLVDFVTEGHTVFISASYIDSTLLDKVYCSQADTEWSSMLLESRYADGKLFLEDTFNYYYYPFINHFTKVDTVLGRVIGKSQAGQPNLIVLFIGKGRMYLHCDPRAFSNYFLLKENNYRYMKQIMEFMKERPGNIFWDDHYNRFSFRENGGRGGKSALDILFQYPELTIAFWILLLLLLFYILFNGKRKQRIIPIIKPIENSSIAFTQAIAGLYMAEKNNKTIADKMITYFNEHIRNRYFLNIHGSGKDFVQALSKKSGVSFESLQALYNTMEQVQLSEEVSDFELLTLNEQIQNFYKNRN